MNPNVIKYLKIKRRINKIDDIDEQDKLYEMLEELYYSFNEDEIAYIESKEE